MTFISLQDGRGNGMGDRGVKNNRPEWQTGPSGCPRNDSDARNGQFDHPMDRGPWGPTSAFGWILVLVVFYQRASITETMGGNRLKVGVFSPPPGTIPYRPFILALFAIASHSAYILFR
jgi:hypothetical protein